MTNYAYGEQVKTTYRPISIDPTPQTRAGIVVEPDVGSGMSEVFFGTQEEYERLAPDTLYDVGFFYADEMEPMGEPDCDGCQ